MLTLTVGLSVTTPTNADGSQKADFLYIGDGGDNSVKRFDATTGECLDDFVLPGSGGLHGPRGLIFTGGKLVVVNQNVNTPFNGEILQYQQVDGAFFDALVPNSHPDSPFAPRGMVKGPGSALFVADLFGESFDFSTQGSVKQYNLTTGELTRKLDTTGFEDNFFPRGVVIGPDGMLYVSVVGVLGPPNVADPLTGYVLRFNAQTGKFINVFASYQPTADDCSKHLHRPEGLVFGPDEKLYVTSFRNEADPNDTNKVLIFSETGECLHQIDLDEVGGPIASAQAILFGPKGRLFVPISQTGDVRRYNVRTKTFNVFVSSANVCPVGTLPLQNPWYLTFGETNPRTLEYDD